ncbi:polyprenyl synthetase family protein [Geomicrobium sp. JCM 19038]|uniref:polyprenyl synthetase family protein n=1 Tax=Geomicrobium sp. JCM 19038 TaxID=1460635 RepID=UPI00045F42C9|nr:farnesyl diphosphate synthase [Geomicrobium sp. JCM 19038]GAK06544.1 octaprenyl-diphosphate synthase [Geomicrobium sp. JCM 19038]
MTNTAVERLLQEHVPVITKTMIDHIESIDCPKQIKEAMLYSLNAGGKRIRPILLVATAKSYGNVSQAAYNVGAALEMIHTYSLIHDDLPSMDDDDYRRGKPTNHRVYGEAFAILAGDALLTESFALISSIAEDEMTPRDLLWLTKRLSEASGARGMVGGQVEDIEGEDRSLTLLELEWIHRHKTGALLEFAVEAGGVIGQAPERDLEYLRSFAKHLGLAFQIKDDILDIEGDEALIGKPTGSDTSNKKSTYPSLLTLEGAKEKLNQHITTAEDALERLSIEADDLLQILHYVAKRDR